MYLLQDFFSLIVCIESEVHVLWYCVEVIGLCRVLSFHFYVDPRG